MTHRWSSPTTSWKARWRRAWKERRTRPPRSADRWFESTGAAMRIRDVEGEMEEPVNLLPLIDTLFFLVMFFLVATKFQEEERDAALALPGLSSSQPLSAVSQQLIINIRDDGTAVVAGRPYTMAELETLMREVARTAAGQNILVRADERSLHKY